MGICQSSKDYKNYSKEMMDIFNCVDNSIIINNISNNPNFNFNYQGGDGHTVLTLAIIQNKNIIVKYMLTKYKKLIDVNKTYFLKFNNYLQHYYNYSMSNYYNEINTSINCDVNILTLSLFCGNYEIFKYIINNFYHEVNWKLNRKLYQENPDKTKKDFIYNNFSLILLNANKNLFIFSNSVNLINERIYEDDLLVLLLRTNLELFTDIIINKKCNWINNNYLLKNLFNYIIHDTPLDGTVLIFRTSKTIKRNHRKFYNQILNEFLKLNKKKINNIFSGRFFMDLYKNNYKKFIRELIIKYNYQINFDHSFKEKTLLQKAISKKDKEFVKFLLNGFKKNRIDLMGKFKNKALSLCLNNNWSDIFKIINNYSNNNLPN